MSEPTNNNQPPSRVGVAPSRVGVAAEWIRSICAIPFTYGIKQLNCLAMNAITLFLNNYGNKFFQTDEKIIRTQESDETTNTFILYPIDIKNSLRQTIGLNLLMIDSGHINEITISIPWKNVLSIPTVIELDSVNLSTSVGPYNPEMNRTILSNTMMMNTTMNDFLNDLDSDTDPDESSNQDITNAYEQINQIVTQYFKSVVLKIALINISINENLRLCLYNISHQNGIIFIEKAEIQDQCSVKIAIVTDISYAIATAKLHICSVSLEIGTSLINILPCVYLNQDPSTIELSVEVEQIDFYVKIDPVIPISIYDMILNLSPKGIAVQHIDKIIIGSDSDVYVGFASDKCNICTFDQVYHTIILGSTIDIHLKNFDILHKLSLFVPMFASMLNNKFISSSVVHNDLIIQKVPNILPIANIYYVQKHFSVSFDKIFVSGDNSQTIGAKASQTGTTTEIKILSMVLTDKINDVELFITETNILSDNLSKKIFLTKSTLKAGSRLFGGNFELIMITKLQTMIEIHLKNAFIRQLILFVTYVLNDFIISNDNDDNDDDDDENIKLESLTQTKRFDINENPQTKVMIFTHESRFSIEKDDQILEFEIIDGIIHPIDKIIMKTNLKWYLNGSHIGDFLIDQIDSGNILLGMCKVYLTPEIFDQLHYLIGTLVPDPETDPQIKKSKIIMSTSVLAESPAQLDVILRELSLDKEYFGQEITLTVAPKINFLLDSLSDLKEIFVNDYGNEEPISYDMSVYVESIHTYLTDEQSVWTYAQPEPFMCVVLSGISFGKENLSADKNQSPKVKYTLQIKNAYAIDMQTTNTEWKHFMRQSYAENLLNVSVVTHDDIYVIKADIRTLTVNIREEILVRLLGFFSNSYKNPNDQNLKSGPMAFIERFEMNELSIYVNFFPMMFDENTLTANMLTLKDFRLRLSGQKLCNIDGFDALAEKIISEWKSDINPYNIMRLIPNVRVIQPFAHTFGQLVWTINKYFGNKHNKRIIRSVTIHIHKGYTFVKALMKAGFQNLSDLFI